MAIFVRSQQLQLVYALAIYTTEGAFPPDSQGHVMCWRERVDEASLNSVRCAAAGLGTLRKFK